MFASPAPTLFLTVRENSKHSPRKRKLPTGQQNVERTKVSVHLHEDHGVQCCIIDPLRAGSMAFSRITREGDVCFYNGMQSTAAFKLVFEHLQQKASVMHYWN